MWYATTRVTHTCGEQIECNYIPADPSVGCGEDMEYNRSLGCTCEISEAEWERMVDKALAEGASEAMWARADEAYARERGK